MFPSFRSLRSCDIDPLQIVSAKYVLDIFRPILSHIYNLTFMYWTCLERMQLANVS